jgi:hypothetical protein
MEFLNAHFCFSMTLQLAELTIVMACRLKRRSSVSSTAMTNRRDDCRAVVLHVSAAGNVVILFINITYSTGRSASNEKPGWILNVDFGAAQSTEQGWHVFPLR